jgi:hypothetical protein
VQQRLSAWLLLWLEALTTSPLAAAGTALKQDLPVLLSALLGDQQAGGRAAAGMRNVPVLGVAAGLQVEQWLPLLAAAAAQADEVDAAEGQEGSQQQQQHSEDEDAGTGRARCACLHTVQGFQLIAQLDLQRVVHVTQLSSFRHTVLKSAVLQLGGLATCA